MKKILIVFLFLLIPFSTFAKSEIGSEIGRVESINKTECTEEEKASDFLATGEVECFDLIIKLSSSDADVFARHVVQSPLDVRVKPGMAVALYTQTDESGNKTYAVKDYDHRLGLFLLFLFFVFSIFLIGGIKGGLRTIISLSVSIALIFLVFIPGIISGSSPLPLVLITGGLITLFALTFLNGFKRKTLVMILGTFSGLLVATLFALIFGNLVQATGFGTEEVRNLVFIRSELDYRGLLFAGIILGALGAVMDVSVSIASSLEELKKEVRTHSFQKFWKSGMQVGKDIMGSMTNTLIFAYIGSAYAVVITFIILGQLSFGEVVNLGFVSEEILRSLVGSLGLIFTIPATAFFGALLLSKKK